MNSFSKMNPRMLPWLVLLIALALRFFTFTPIERVGFDEHAYLEFAKVFDHFGLPGIREIAHNYATDPELAKSPLPLRIGFVALATWTCQFQGSFTVQNIAWISLVAGVGFVVVTYLLVNALAGPKLGLCVSLLVLSSPLAIALSRRAMQDALVGLVILLVLYFFHQSWRRRRLVDPILLGLSIAAGLLLKEATLFIYPSLAFAAVYYLRGKPVGDWRLILAALAAGPLLYLGVMQVVAGGLPAYFHLYREYSAMQSKLVYTMTYGRGAWFRYFVDFFLLSPVTLALALASVAVPTPTAAEREAKTLAWIYLLGGTLVFGMLPVLAVRVVLYLDVFIRILAALTALWIAREWAAGWRRSSATAFTCLTLATLLFFDGWQYHRLFQIGQVYDPTTVELIRANGFWQLWSPPKT